MKLALSLAFMAVFTTMNTGGALAAPAAAEADRGEGTGREIASAEVPAFELSPGASAAPAPLGPSDQGEAQGQDEPQVPAPRPFAMQKPVFDDTWVSLGIGLGVVPSYAGSDDYQAFPLPLIAGRVGGVGISPNGPGFVLDVFSPAPTFGPRKTTFSAGPALRVRADRAQQIGDEVVDRLEKLNLAFEVGGNVGVSFPGVFTARDSLTLGAQVRWDVAGAHDGMVIEPQIGYRRTFGTGIIFQTQAGFQLVDNSFAEYYFSVTPAQSAASGLPQFDAKGGLNSLGSLTILNFDLDANVLNGGLSIYTVLGYSRLVGDGKSTPFTDLRGNPNQFLGGVGLAYTF